MATSRAAQRLDDIADHLQAMAPNLPREASSHLKNILVRLDRVSNSLEQQRSRRGSASRVAEIESELESAGLDFSVDPNIQSRDSTSLFISKGQDDPRREAEILGGIAGKHHLLLDSRGSQRVHKLTIPHN
jgi:hypothetical protein